MEKDLPLPLSKESEVVVLISDRKKLKARKITMNKEEHFIMVKVPFFKKTQ